MARQRQSIQEDFHPENTLTVRELECVSLMAYGLTIAGIADFQGTALVTIRHQLCTAYSKIGVDSDIEAVSWWHERFGDRAQVEALKTKLEAAENTIAMFGDSFRMAVEAEVGRRVRNIVAYPSSTVLSKT